MGRYGIRSLKPNLSGMTLYKFLIPRPYPSSLSSDVIETQFGHSQCEGFIICEQSNHVRPKDSSRDEPKAQIWRSVIIGTNLLSGKNLHLELVHLPDRLAGNQTIIF